MVLCEGAENGIGEEDMNGSDASANGSEKIEQFKVGVHKITKSVVWSKKNTHECAPKVIFVLM